MRIAISNIAWEVAEDSAIAEILVGQGLDAIDIAPGKYFSDPAGASTQEIAEVRQWWAARGIAVTGMQALLFGTSGLNLFADHEGQQRMLDRLASVCWIGEGLGARCLVFGSPKNRDRCGLDDAQAADMAAEFFGRLGDIASNHGVVICLEPNPPIYGANFMTTAEETAMIVRQVGHDHIRMQFDTGALTINGENADAVLSRFAGFVAHVHASEPNLVTLGDGGTDHATMAAAVRLHCPDRVVSIEMVASKNENHAAAIARAVTLAKRFYGNGGAP